MNNAILSYTITSDDTGKTVEIICKKKLEISSKLFTRLKLNGKIRLNDSVCKSIDLVNKDDVISVDVTETESSSNIVPTNLGLDILYEDDFILVVNKPRRMSVHPSIGNFTNTLANGVIFHWIKNGEEHKFHAVNRIDKNTSGICVIAKNQFAHGVLSSQIKNKTFVRKYKAVVVGKLNPAEGIIDKPIKRETESIIKRIVDDSGKSAVTEYKTIKSNRKYSLVEVVLHTGRTHQIRVHFSYMGNPLVGDWLYGNEEGEEVNSSGHLLHAYYVSFIHPYTKKELIFETSLPKDMADIL